MAEIKWIKLSVNMFDDEKIKLIRTLPEGDSIVIVWVQLLCLAGKINDGGAVYLGQNLAYTDEMLSTIFTMPLQIVRLALKTLHQFQMINADSEGVIDIANWEKHQNIDAMDKIREQTRKRVAKHRETKALEDSNVTVTLRNATDKKEEEDKKDIERKAVDIFFENIWKEYPEKKGKSQISQTTRRKLHKVGAETLLRAIRNYEDDLRINDWKKPMHGSTFFNGRYEDYLQVEEKPKVQFLNIGDDDDAL